MKYTILSEKNELLEITFIRDNRSVTIGAKCKKKEWEWIFENEKPTVIAHIQYALDKAPSHKLTIQLLANGSLRMEISSDLLDDPLVRTLESLDESEDDDYAKSLERELSYLKGLELN